MNHSFSLQLQTLRKAAGFTNNQLAQRSNVPRSLVAGLQSGKRRIGEYQARKIGQALYLNGEQLEQFILAAINNCSEKVLIESRSYPAELLNVLAKQLRRAGILPEQISGCAVAGDGNEQDVMLNLNNGRKATIRTQLSAA